MNNKKIKKIGEISFLTNLLSFPIFKRILGVGALFGKFYQSLFLVLFLLLLSLSLVLSLLGSSSILSMCFALFRLLSFIGLSTIFCCWVRCFCNHEQSKKKTKLQIYSYLFSRNMKIKLTQMTTIVFVCA